MYRLLALVMVFLFWCAVFVEHSKAAQKAFEVFDGQVYNQKFYPRIDTIEWGDAPSTMQFQVWWKGHPVEMAFDVVEKPGGGRKMRVNYYIVERKEHVCRELPAPAHFNKSNFKAYQSSDSDRDMIILAVNDSAEVKGLKSVELKKYEPCVEDTEDSVDVSVINKAQQADQVPKASVSSSDKSDKKEEKPNTDTLKYKTPDGSIKKPGAGAPFTDW